MAHRWQVRVDMKLGSSASESIQPVVIHAVVICCSQCVDRSSMSSSACCSERFSSDVARRAFASHHLSVCLSFATCVCLPACDSQRRAHYSDRRSNAFLIYESVVEVLLRNGGLSVCVRLGSTRRAFTSHHVSVCLSACDSGRLVASSVCLRLGSRALLDA